MSWLFTTAICIHDTIQNTHAITNIYITNIYITYIYWIISILNYHSTNLICDTHNKAILKHDKTTLKAMVKTGKVSVLSSKDVYALQNILNQKNFYLHSLLVSLLTITMGYQIYFFHLLLRTVNFYMEYLWLQLKLRQGERKSQVLEQGR